jgi:hypothetical protein
MEMDELLRVMSFGLRITKADLVRGFVSRGLAELAQELSKDRTEEAVDRLTGEFTEPLTPEEAERLDRATSYLEYAAARRRAAA